MRAVLLGYGAAGPAYTAADVTEGAACRQLPAARMVPEGASLAADQDTFRSENTRRDYIRISLFISR